MFTFNRCRVNETPSMSHATTSSDGHVYWPAFTRIPMPETRIQGSRSRIHVLELRPQLLGNYTKEQTR
jgi:hypothetical protein